MDGINSSSLDTEGRSEDAGMAIVAGDADFSLGIHCNRGVAAAPVASKASLSITTICSGKKSFRRTLHSTSFSMRCRSTFCSLKERRHQYNQSHSKQNEEQFQHDPQSQFISAPHGLSVIRVLLSPCGIPRFSIHVHGKVKFGSLMGALKLVRTSSKLAHFDALFLHNV